MENLSNQYNEDQHHESSPQTLANLGAVANESVATGEGFVAEKFQPTYDYLYRHCYSPKRIDALIYETPYEAENDESGVKHNKRDESGHPIETVDKTRLKQPVEYLYSWKLSIPDLCESELVKPFDSQDIENFIEECFTITDNGYYPEFNSTYNFMDSLRGIVEKRKNHQPLSEEERDLAYACHPNHISDTSTAYCYYDDEGAPCYDNTGDTPSARLLFGTPDIYTAPELLRETERVAKDSPEKFVQRISIVDAERRLIGKKFDEPFYPKKKELFEQYEQAKFQICQSIRENLPAISEEITREKAELEKISENLAQLALEGKSDDAYEEVRLEQEKKYHLEDKLHQFGLALLGNFGPYDLPTHAPEDRGIANLMKDCGISSDQILDTYFGGPKRFEEAAYKPTYSHLEARHVKNLLKTGLTKEEIISNIKRKNTRDNWSVAINAEEVQRMREAGFEGADIIDATQEWREALTEQPGFSRSFLKQQGFTDEDIIKYLAKELKTKTDDDQFDYYE